MERRGNQLQRGIAIAAVLLFAAAQLIELSHFHSEPHHAPHVDEHADQHTEDDSMCVVCAHASALDGAPTLAPTATGEHPNLLPENLQALRVVAVATDFGQQPRAPPYSLS